MPAIVLLTDFGSKDYFVGVMKGVIAGINPVARVIDLSHEIAPQNVGQAAFVLWASYKYLPDDSIIVCVVDPGVGSDRKIICGTVDGRTFIAPDNGLLDYVVADGHDIEFHEAANQSYFLKQVSATFHGRDKFAPLAAHLSRGVRLAELGEMYRYPKVGKFYSPIAAGKNEGKIVYEDRFGNLFTSLLWNESLLTGSASVKICGRAVRRFFRTYSESPFRRGVVGIGGSTGLLELAVNGGSAAKMLGSSVGDRVTLLLKG